MKNSKTCDYVQNQNGRPIRYKKTDGKTEKDTETRRTGRTPPEMRKSCRRRIKHCVVAFLEKPGSGLQPDNGVLQEHRRLDEVDNEQADCG